MLFFFLYKFYNIQFFLRMLTKTTLIDDKIWIQAERHPAILNRQNHKTNRCFHTMLNNTLNEILICCVST